MEGAQAKVGNALLGGRNAERRLEEAVEATEAILERVGLPTYSAYVMAVLGTVDAELEDRVARGPEGPGHRARVGGG